MVSGAAAKHSEKAAIVKRSVKATKGRIAGINVVEYAPQDDIDGIGAMNVARLIAAMLGLLARQTDRT